MKKFFSIMIGAAAALLAGSSCSSLLEEDPHTLYVPSFFETEVGVNGGLTSLYYHLRNLYGPAGAINNGETGTDEYTYGSEHDNDHMFTDLTTGVRTTMDAASNPGGYVWTGTFSYINTASGIIENAEKVGLSASLIAEARFFRAFDYFLLVQTFGGVPLDLGSGELAFNTSTVRTSTRNTVPEVYTKAIFPDLITAVNDLPEKPRVVGGVTKTVARFYLAKAYLTYAWWLENPGNISTYPPCDRKDPDGKSAAQYFQLAYDTAVEAINNPGPYGLQETFYEVNAGQFDRNKEWLLWADHTETSQTYNGTALSGFANAGGNWAHWYTQWAYSNMKLKDASTGNSVVVVTRGDSQFLGRPWTRMAPTHEAYERFTDKDMDSRFDGTFSLVYRGNFQYLNPSVAAVIGANGMTINAGEPIVKFLTEDPGNITYPTSGANDDTGMGLGTMPGVPYYVVGYSDINRFAYPGLWKIGPYRTNTSGYGEGNVPSTRPFCIAKFSELYFIAAEAAVKGASTKSGQSAYDLLNVIRARAGKWIIKNNEQQEYNADFSTELVAKTPKTITLDYLLDEKSREFFGEGLRWYDLVRTQTWYDRAHEYSISGTDGKTKAYEHTLMKFTRDIDDHFYLRPIPLSQLNNMEMTDEEKAAYQNPGY